MKNRKDLRFPIIMFQFWDSYFELKYDKETFKRTLDMLSITEDMFRDPNYKLDGNQYYSILELLLKEDLNEPPSLHTLRLTSMNNMGMAGFAGITAVTLKDALNIALSAYKYFMPAVELNLDNIGGQYQLGIEMASDFDRFNPFIIELTLGAFKQFAEEIVGEQIEIKIEFSHSLTWGDNKDIAAQHYSKYFKCDVIFNAPKSRLTANIKTLEKKSKKPNQVLHKYAREVLHKELDKQKHQPAFTEKVKHILELNTDNDVILNLSQLAQHLNITSRTLCRKLAKDNTQFQTLLNKVRFEKAKKELRKGDASIKSLALNLGFSNSESFSKAFKVYTGHSPSQWKENIK